MSAPDPIRPAPSADDQRDDDSADRFGDGSGSEDGTALERPARSGLTRVDAVVDAVADLDGRPLEEHLGVIETAHDELRAALDDDGPHGPGDAAATDGESG